MLRNEVQDFGCTRNRVDGAWGQWSADLLGDVTCRNLVAEAFDCLWARADPDDAGGDYRASEVCVFGEKAVAGVNRIRTRFLGNRKNLVDDQVGFGRGRAVQGVCLVGHFDVQCVAVLVGINGYRSEPRILSGSNDSNGDFASVCNQNLGDFACSCSHNPQAYWLAEAIYWRAVTK